MRATLTGLRRNTSEVIRPAIHAGEKVTLAEHGEDCAEIIPLRKINREQALKDLMAISPVNVPSRK